MEPDYDGTNFASKFICQAAAIAAADLAGRRKEMAFRLIEKLGRLET
jgi:hypothetical protein